MPEGDPVTEYARITFAARPRKTTKCLLPQQHTLFEGEIIQVVSKLAEVKVGPWAW